MLGRDLADRLTEISWRALGYATHLKEQDGESSAALHYDIVGISFAIAAEIVDEVWGDVEVPELDE